MARARDSLDDLYGLPLEQFTKARNELARELKEAGDRERADTVRRLTKPSRAAWAVNQTVRAHPKELRALLEAAKRLRKAQESVLAGKGRGDALERAAAAERKAVEDLVSGAGDLAGGDGRGLTDATLQGVRESLHSVALDDEVRELVKAGRLDRERRSAGLGAFSLPAARKAESGPKAKDRKQSAAQQQLRDAKATEREGRRKLADADKAVRRAERAQSKAERNLEQARDRSRELQEQLTRARDRVQKAEKKLSR